MVFLIISSITIALLFNITGYLNITLLVISILAFMYLIEVAMLSLAVKLIESSISDINYNTNNLQILRN